MQVFFVVMVRFAVWRKDSKKFWTVKLKESSYLMFVIFTDFQHANLYPVQNLSHGFIVKYRIRKNLSKFHPQHSYEIYKRV